VRALSVADASIGVVPDAGSDLALTPVVGFATEVEKPDILLRASWATGPPEPAGDRLFDAGGVWDLSRADDEYHFRFFARGRSAIPYKEARVNADFTSGRVTLRPEFFAADTPRNPLGFPLDELLMVHYLSTRGGVMVHACGVVAEGAGYLFVGHSGAGKTTTALLWERQSGARVVCDDRIVLRRKDGKILMYGTPWHGSGRLASPEAAPLQAIFLLEHGERNELRPIAGADAVATLIARCFLPYHNRAGVASAVALFEEILAEVPCLRFRFVPDESAVAAVRAWERGRRHA
jgi:hypothetical protein